MIRKWGTLVLIIVLVCLSSCSTKEKTTSKPMELEEKGYDEITMSSLLDSTPIDRIRVWKDGKEYSVRDAKEVSTLMDLWEKACIANAQVSAPKEDYPPGLFTPVVQLIKGEKGENLGQRTSVGINNSQGEFSILYQTPDKKEFNIEGEPNTELKLFIQKAEMLLEQ